MEGLLLHLKLGCVCRAQSKRAGNCLVQMIAAAHEAAAVYALSQAEQMTDLVTQHHAAAAEELGGAGVVVTVASKRKTSAAGGEVCLAKQEVVAFAAVCNVAHGEAHRHERIAACALVLQESSGAWSFKLRAVPAQS